MSEYSLPRCHLSTGGLWHTGLGQTRCGVLALVGDRGTSAFLLWEQLWFLCHPPDGFLFVLQTKPTSDEMTRELHYFLILKFAVIFSQ